MEDLIRELDLLLKKYGISFNEAMRIYERNKICTKRLTQCYEDDEKVWQYYDKENNPCGCGSNCFHFEYDRIDNVIYGVCNCCNTDIYIIKDEYVEEKLHTGKWLSECYF